MKRVSLIKLKITNLTCGPQTYTFLQDHDVSHSNYSPICRRGHLET